MLTAQCSACETWNVHPFCWGQCLYTWILRERGHVDTVWYVVDRNTTLLLEVFKEWNFVADFNGFLSKFVRKMSNLGIWTPFLGSYRRHTTLVDVSFESPWSTFYSPLLNFFAVYYGSREAKCVQLGCFCRGLTSLHSNFIWRGSSSSNHSWRQKTRDTVLPDGEDCSLILTQYHSMTDRQTDLP